MEALTILIYILLAIGVVFNVIGTIGLLRFPDVYTRLHAETKTTTFGSIFIAIGVAVFCFAQGAVTKDSSSVSLGVHALVAMLVLAFTNATGSHAIAMAAHARGQKLAQGVVDRLKEDEEKKAVEDKL